MIAVAGVAAEFPVVAVVVAEDEISYKVRGRDRCLVLLPPLHQCV